ncbi:hypothetical protein HMPREF9374_1967 [Desmospora sp. 8437]|nr:hypothetical protein HMPREF9374_1967 [Desmospora sp. 8437]
MVSQERVSLLSIYTIFYPDRLKIAIFRHENRYFVPYESSALYLS